MRIKIRKFGEMLISRPEGRDAALVIQNQFIKGVQDREVILDFQGVLVLTPSWMDEIYRVLVEKFGEANVKFENTQNASVRASIETVLNPLAP